MTWQLAWCHSRDAAPMIAFLNTRNEALDGQPIELAVQSETGLERVDRLLQQMTRNPQWCR